MTATVVPGGFTLGLDLGDRRHHVCVLDAAGQIVRAGSLTNTRRGREVGVPSAGSLSLGLLFT